MISPKFYEVFIKKYLLVSILVLVGMFSLYGIARAASGPSFIVTPGTTNLVSGDQITVTGSNYYPTSPGSILECSTAKTASGNPQPTVELDGLSFANVPVSCSAPNQTFETDSSGDFTQTFTIVTGITGPPNRAKSGTAYDEAQDYPCPPTAAQIKAGATCEILVGVLDGQTGASYEDPNPQPITFSPISTTTSIALSSPKLTYGSEQSERVSVTVLPSGENKNEVDGTATVKESGKTLCSITVMFGAGSCNLSATSLNAGSNRLIATYNGDGNYGNDGVASNYVSSSSTTGGSLSVLKAKSTMTLRLSSARLTYGKEQSERISVTLAPSLASGSVTIKASNILVCRISFTKGSTKTCALTSKKLAPGSYKVVASYGGSANASPSISAFKTLSVVK